MQKTDFCTVDERGWGGGVAHIMWLQRDSFCSFDLRRRHDHDLTLSELIVLESLTGDLVGQIL